MTDLQKVFNEMVRHSVGLETMMDTHKQIADVAARVNSNFPAYNIKKTGDNEYEIELAVAGYSIADISIELEKNVLVIKSAGHELGDTTDSFIYRGFTYKGFQRMFSLENNVRVNDAELVNGLLKVYLERLVPEEQKPKRINIRPPSKAKKPGILNEDSDF